MSAIISPVTQWISENVGWTVLIVIALFSVFFEISKIKLYPITTLLKWIGSRFTGDLKATMHDLKKDTNTQIKDLKFETEKQIKELDDRTTSALTEIKSGILEDGKQIQAKLAEIEIAQDLGHAARIKAHVLNFSRSLRIGEKHTEEDFRNLIRENEEYERLTKKHNWKNNVYQADYDFFYKEYMRCQRENDFLR